MEEWMYRTATAQLTMNRAERRKWQAWQKKMMRAFPHHVDLDIPESDAFDAAVADFMEARKGKADFYADISDGIGCVRYLFKDPADAEAFRKQFGIHLATTGKPH